MFPHPSSRKAQLIVESAVLQRFNRYADDVVDWARAHPLVTGLVFFGSSADRSRVDEWSDHDFAVVVATGDQETLRGDVGWLPRSAEIVTSARQHHDGFIAFYRDGSVVEFAVVDTTELGAFLAHPWSIAYDEGGVRRDEPNRCHPSRGYRAGARRIGISRTIAHRSRPSATRRDTEREWCSSRTRTRPRAHRAAFPVVPRDPPA